MIDAIERLRDLDDQIFTVDQKLAPHIEWLISESPIPKTSQLFIMYITSTNFIKNSIFDCSETEDIYSVKILFRSILEHHLRFQFLFMQFGLVKDDSVSSEYYTVLELSEHVDYLKSLQAVRLLKQMETIDLKDMWDILTSEYPQYKSYDRKNIEETAKKYSTKNIIRFIERTIKISNSNNTLSNILLEYSELSSFVHGGIFAFNEMKKYSNDEKREEELIRLAAFSLQVATAIKSLSLLIFSIYKKEILEIHFEINNLMKKI